MNKQINKHISMYIYIYQLCYINIYKPYRCTIWLSIRSKPYANPDPTPRTAPKKNCADSRPLQSLGASIGEAPDLLGTLHTWGALLVGDVDPTAPAAAPPVRSAIPALGCAMYLGDGSSTRNCKKMKPFSSKVSVYWGPLWLPAGNCRNTPHPPPCMA